MVSHVKPDRSAVGYAITFASALPTYYQTAKKTLWDVKDSHTTAEKASSELNQ